MSNLHGSGEDRTFRLARKRPQGEVRGCGVSRIGDRLARLWRFEEGDAVVEIIERNKDAFFFRPFSHPAIAAMTPRQDLDPPPSAAHPPQVRIEANTIGKAAAVAREQHDNTGVSVIVQCIAQHCGLQ